MKKTLSILSDGSILTRQVVNLASLLGYEFIKVFGDEVPIASNLEFVFQAAEAAEKENHEALFVALVDSRERAALITRWSGSNLVNLIHPRAILCGYVTLNDFAFVGGGATLKPGVTVGSGVTLGTGAVLVSDALEAGVYVGNPAKKMQTRK